MRVYTVDRRSALTRGWPCLPQRMPRESGYMGGPVVGHATSSRCHSNKSQNTVVARSGNSGAFNTILNDDTDSVSSLLRGLLDSPTLPTPTGVPPQIINNGAPRHNHDCDQNTTTQDTLHLSSRWAGSRHGFPLRPMTRCQEAVRCRRQTRRFHFQYRHQPPRHTRTPSTATPS